MRHNRRPRRRAPICKALYNLLGRLDPEVPADTLNGWLDAHRGSLPRALARDGKYVRDLPLTLSLSEHNNGAPAAVTFASKEPNSGQSKTGSELTAAARLCAQLDLSNAVVTTDALH